MSQALAFAQHWLSTTEPALDPEWSRLASSPNTLITVTLEEAEAIEHAIQDLVAPYVQRGEQDAQPEARPVRLIHLCLPEATTLPIPRSSIVTTHSN